MEVREWLPDLAQVIGARPPYHVPSWVGRLAVGAPGLSMMTEARGSSNGKAKGALGWQPTYATWREGFRRGLPADAIKAPASTRSGPMSLSSKLG